MATETNDKFRKICITSYRQCKNYNEGAIRIKVEVLQTV